MLRPAMTVMVMMILLLGAAAEGRAEPREGERPPSREQMEKVRKRIETLRMWRLTKALDLDEKSSAQLFPLLNKYDRRRAEAESAVREDMRVLREAVRDNKDAQIKAAMERLERAHDSLQKIRDEERADLRKILTVRQQAEFILVMQEFDMEIRRIIAEARDRRPGRDDDRPVRERPERPLQPGRE